MTATNEYLEHFGVKGMRWGHRKPQEAGSDSSGGKAPRLTGKEKAQLRIDKYGGSRSKAAWVEVGKFVARGVIMNAGASLAARALPQHATTIAGANAAAGLVNDVVAIKNIIDIKNAGNAAKERQ